MSKHTAGPWRYKEWGGLIVGGGTGSDEILICTMAVNTRHDEGRCNRELILAAPTMQAELTAERERADRAEAERDVLRDNQLGPVPEGPLMALGAWIADHTDEDEWLAAERFLNAALAEMQVMRDDAEIGRRWSCDSSLETWFPYTAEELARTKVELAGARLQVAAQHDAMRIEWKDMLARADRAEAERDELRERADRADKRSEFHHQNHLAAEREIDALRERVARLVGVIEDAPHDYKCETLLDWHRQAGSYRMMDDSKCNCWKRTALEGK